MNEPITVTTTVAAWLPNHYSIDELLDAIKGGSPQSVTDMLSLRSWDLSGGERPYVRVGEAEITVTIKPRDELTAVAVHALQNELQAARAAFAVKQAEVLARISKLQALTNEVQV